MAKFMIVDDSFIMRRRIKSILVMYGHEVIAEAENAVQAYNQYQKYNPDIVTMDITMPEFRGIEMDGIDALKKIIGDFPKAKIVMISALGQKDKILEAVKSGAKNYIIKPFQEENFMQIINKVLACENDKNINPS